MTAEVAGKAAPKKPRPYDAPLPARWTSWQRLKNTLIYGIIRALLWPLRRLPSGFAIGLGALLGWAVSWVPTPEHGRARRQLQEAFPEYSAREIRQIARRMWIHLGRASMEIVHCGALLDSSEIISFGPEQRQLFDDAASEGRGVIAVTGHIGNWELLAQLIAHAGYDISAAAKPLYDPRLTRLVHQHRTAHGLKVLWRGDKGGAINMLRTFKRGGIVAMLIDQDTRVPGAFVPFFGREAYTPTVAASVAIRTKAPVLVGWLHRKGRRFEPHFERVEVPTEGSEEERVVALTARLTERLEAAIREAPEQWVWMHKRWKRRPEASKGGVQS